tara:strand:- start:57 stop:950 length:894 start_codon:yes stop_codon:yes gene_type:complete
MAIYLGSKGRVELQRTFGSREIVTTISDNEVVATKKRLGFDLASQGDTSELITGDELEIRADSNLVFISGYTGVKTGKFFIHVDELGGIRLYATYAHAITGGTSNAISLVAQSSGWSLDVRFTVQNAIHRILGQVTSYELNTSAEVVDTTALSDDFRNSINGILSGSGRLESFWDYRDTVGAGEYESAQYLHQLVLRSDIGSEFNAHFYLKIDGYDPSGGGAEIANDVIWYDVKGLITNTAIAFNTGQLVKMTADFVTTGKINLKVMTAAEYKLLQENTDFLLLEQDSSANLLLETD